MCHREIFLFQRLVNVREEFFETMTLEKTPCKNPQLEHALQRIVIYGQALFRTWRGQWCGARIRSGTERRCSDYRWESSRGPEDRDAWRCHDWIDESLSRRKFGKSFFEYARIMKREPKKKRVIKSYGEAYNHSLRYAE